MNVNYDRVCRLCLSSRCELLPIFPTTSSDDSEPPLLASKIKDCVSVQISESDDLPTNVCRKCCDNVINWHIFKTVCERSQNKLQSLINKECNQLDEEVNIKSEPLSDEAYDDGVVIDGSYPESENAGANKVQPEGPPILASLGLTPRSDKKDVDPRMDWHRVHAILEMVQQDEVIDTLQSMEECDVIHQSDHDSESETDLNNDSIDDEFVDFKNGYVCRNKKIISKKPKLSTVECLNKIRQARKLRKRNNVQTKHCPLIKNAWQLLFTDDLLELIVTSTNEKIYKYNKNNSKPTNVSEIRILIGILYFHGIMRPTHQKYSELWDNEYGVPCVRNVMTLERFKCLLQNLSFHNENDDIVQFDVMKRMRKVFEIFALNCRTSLDVGDLVVIDEIISPIHGPCPFRYNIDNKKIKSGLKVVILLDPENFYVANLDVITDPYFGCDEIASKLVQHLAGTGKTVIMDSWFTSNSLMTRLKDEYNLYCIGAVNPKDEIIPPFFLSHYRKERSFINGFLDKDISLTSYVDRKSKVIHVLNNDPKFYKKTNIKHTSVASLYKKYQSSIEVIDVLMHYYTTMQHSNDWTLSLFFILLNIASINAQVIWSSYNQTIIVQRRLFIRELALSLMETEEQLPSYSTIDVKRLKFSSTEHVKQFYKNRRRCKPCFRTKKLDRRTKQFCLKCGTFICKEHTVTICTSCVTPAS